MQVKIGYSAVDLTVNDPEAIDSEGRPYRMVRRAENTVTRPEKTGLLLWRRNRKGERPIGTNENEFGGCRIK